MGTGYRIRERNLFVLFAVPSSAWMLRRAPYEGEGREAGRAGKGCKYEVCLEHSHGRTACTLANASESLQLSAEKALGTLGGVMAFHVFLRSSLFSICSCSAFLLGLSVADGINTACVGFSSLAQRQLCGIGF